MNQSQIIKLNLIDEPLTWLNESIANYKVELVIDDIGKTFTLDSF